MSLFRKMTRLGAGSALPCHFARVLHELESTLSGTGMFPGMSDDSNTFAAGYLKYNLKRKAASLHGQADNSEVRRNDTLAGFLLRETVNKRINDEELFGYCSSTGSFSSDLVGLNLLYQVRDLIGIIIGDKPNISKIIRRSSFGNGASATLPRKSSQDFNKFEEGLSVTPRLYNTAALAVCTSPLWNRALSTENPVYCSDHNGVLSSFSLTRVSGSVLDTVPKDATIDRIIMKEPELNGFIQKGIGSELRNLLRRPHPEFGLPGVSLNSSGAVNSALAREGSETGMWATVDAERASDSITLALLEFLLPGAWFELLCDARSPYTVIDGKLHRLSMMSGMGNGFTFELESIVFYAIGFVCSLKSSIPFAEQAVCIHGDDLIVPCDVEYYVKEAYKAAGLVINATKSYFTGPFRESCGGHYFNGDSVKPFYVKTQNGLTRGDWFWLYNSLLLWLNERSDCYRATKEGKNLMILLSYIGWYASSGFENLWKTPCDSSRRSGLFSEAPMLQGAKWKNRNIIASPKSERSSDLGRLCVWLNQPRISPSVLELCSNAKPLTDPYSYDTDVVEVEKFVRRCAWASFSDVSLATPLWLLERRKLQLTK